MRGGMWGLSRRSRERGLAVIALLGGVGLGSWAAGLTARSHLAPQPTIVEMPPAEIVHLRFPADWLDAQATPAVFGFAATEGGINLFDPRPIAPVAALMEATAREEPRAEPSAPVIRTASADPASVPLRSVSRGPASPRPAHRSNAVLNESQIASIKRRLNLTPEQERYWPAVAAELRKMEYSRDASGKSTQGTKMASVDMSKVDVEGLKSAGFPMVMSFSDDQRRELRSLAHLLGLESVMSGL